MIRGTIPVAIIKTTGFCFCYCLARSRRSVPCWFVRRYQIVCYPRQACYYHTQRYPVGSSLVVSEVILLPWGILSGCNKKTNMASTSYRYQSCTWKHPGKSESREVSFVQRTCESAEWTDFRRVDDNSTSNLLVYCLIGCISLISVNNTWYFLHRKPSRKSLPL